jgi:micrococcal nuclease
VKSSGKFDRYNGLLAEIILANGINVNKTLVKNGLAWHFKNYSKDLDYANLEIAAKQKKLIFGLIKILLHLGNGDDNLN